MKIKVFLFSLFVLGAAEVLHAEDPLDAKLNALKKKAPQRTYSATATLNDQNLVVPKPLTDEEKALDAKIRAMEKEQDTQPAMMSQQAPRPAVKLKQKSPGNWLTPALLDEASGKKDTSGEEETSWVTVELARQESRRQNKLTQAEEKKLVEQRVREELRSDTDSSFAPANDYNSSLQNIISGDSPSMTPLKESPDDRRFLLNRPQRRPSTSSIKTLSESSSSLSPFSRSQSSEIGKQPARTYSPFLQEQDLNSDFTRRAASPVSRQPADEKEPEPVRTRIRPTSPFDENPFEKDVIPGIKRSIWD